MNEGAAVAIIPARGGSKRIPRKNVRAFAGVPIIGRSIRVAVQSGCFSRVIVSTDDDEVAQVAENYGAEVPFRRPPELADDHATTDAVLHHALGFMEEAGWLPTLACCLYATAPLVRPEDLVRGREILRDKAATTAIAVTPYPFPIQRALAMGEDGRLRMVEPAMRLVRSQDLPPRWHDAGAFYWLDVARYRGRGLYNDNMVPVELPAERVVDIDTPEDWRRAEVLYRMLNEDHASV